MDPARAAFGTVGCAAQIELGKVARFEWQPRMCRGRERRDVCGPGRRTRARRNGERWCEIYRHRRLHQARLGDIGEAASALDSQVYGVLLKPPFCRSFPARPFMVRPGRNEVLNHGGIRTRSY